MSDSRIIRVGLAGNPNSGKTTLFNAITGSSQKTGNYAGVTVEKKEGKKIRNGIEYHIFDLPGVYSLTAYSADEVIARDFVLDERPDVIVDVLDATNIERNLYLCLQFQELGIPIVGALNIADQAEARGIIIDSKYLSLLLGIPLVRTVGTKGGGIAELLDAVAEAANGKDGEQKLPSYGEELEAEIAKILDVMPPAENLAQNRSNRWLAIKLLEKDANAISRLTRFPNAKDIEKLAAACIHRIEKHFGRDSEIVVSEQRYAYVHGAVAESVTKVSRNGPTLTEAIDKVLVNRFFGLFIFLFILWSIFQITFTLGAYPMEWLGSFFKFLSSNATGALPDGILRSLIVDGVIGGVGGVLNFVPLIAILFLCISILEDTGYMARVAFIMDRFLHIFGLHGQSFLPMMVGFGCSVPAIMAARALKSRRDRIITILVTPFMSCGAKLPVHVLLAGTFFPKNSGNMVMLIYIIGVMLAMLSSLFYRKTVLRGEDTPFVMELPPYRMPTGRGIAWHVASKTGYYLKKAGTVLLAASILIWVVVTFPKPIEDPAKYEKIMHDYRQNQVNTDKIRAEIVDMVSGKTSLESIADATARTEAHDLREAIINGKKNIETIVNERADAIAQNYSENLRSEFELSYSLAGRIGKWMEPVIRPLGFDWKIGISVVTGFAAKEAVVSTLGVLYKVGHVNAKDENLDLRASLKADKTFNPLVAFVLMLFTLILAPCISAQSTIKAEIGWKWLGFFVAYTTFVAWGIGFLVYQIGKTVGWGV